MIAAALWVTSDEAKIFKFNPEGVAMTHLHESGPFHNSQGLGRSHPKAGDDTDRFLHHIADAMIHLQADRWLVMGPGVVKTQFKHMIEKHYELNAKKIVGVIPMNKSTDGELKNFAHDFFRKEGLLEGSMDLSRKEKAGR